MLRRLLFSSPTYNHHEPSVPQVVKPYVLERFYCLIDSSNKKCPGHVVASFPVDCACKTVESSNPKCKQGRQLASVFSEPIQCSHNPSLSWQVGNIVSKFPVLSRIRQTKFFIHDEL